jgi:hypothetical protein
VDEIFVLATSVPNHRMNDLILDPRALPQIIEWPSMDYYQVAGEFLPPPWRWARREPILPPARDFDFSSKSPIKKFNPSPKK